MREGKVNLGYRLLHGLTYHPWLKLIALFLAIVVWFYVSSEINRFN